MSLKTQRANLPANGAANAVAVGDSKLNPSGNGAIADNSRQIKNADQFNPFPIEALPEVLRKFAADVAESVGCDPSFSALAAIAVAASAIGTSRELCVKRGWYVPPVIWAVLLGESGTQKSPPFRMAMAPLKERQNRDAEEFAKAMQKYKEDLRDYKAALRDLECEDKPPEPEKPTRPRCVVQDSTIEALATILNDNPRGLLLARDELSGWLAAFDKYSPKSAASSEVPKWLEIYNTEPITIDRKTGDQRFIFVQRPSVCILGGIQPGILSRCLTSEHRDNGLQSRLLMVFPPRQPKCWRDHEINEGVHRAYKEAIQDLFELRHDDASGETKPAVLTLSDDARQIFRKYVNATGAEQAALHGHIASQWSKLEEVPARLATVIHCVRQVSGYVSEHFQVDGDTMSAAVRLGEWFKSEHLRIERLLTEPEELRELRHLADWICSRGGTISARDLCKSRRDIETSDDAETLLLRLVAAGAGQWNGAHKSRVFVLSES